MSSNDFLRTFFLDFDRASRLIDIVNDPAFRRPIPSFPPTDVIQKDNNWIIRMAVAGYTPDDITVVVEDEQLIVKSAKTDNGLKLPEGAKILSNGISKREFERRWQLAEGMEVVDVSLQDGILVIGVTQTIPEAKKPKTLDINKKTSSWVRENFAGYLN